MEEIISSIIINPGSFKCETKAPSSKSMSIRAIAAACLSRLGLLIYDYSDCLDGRAALNCAKTLGLNFTISGRELRVKGGIKRKKRPVVLDCGESALTVNLFSFISALHNEKTIVTGNSTLNKRNFSELESALTQLGYTCKSNNGYLPFEISGKICNHQITIDGSTGSQVLSGLLMSMPLYDEDTRINVNNLKSKPYITMTLHVLSKLGIAVENNNFEVFNIKKKQQFRRSIIRIDGDWSGASFLMVAAAIAGKLEIKGLDIDSELADWDIINNLANTKALVIIQGPYIFVEKMSLNPIFCNLSDNPDLFPPLAVLACYCERTSVLIGVSRLVNKESNRAQALSTELTKLGANIKIDTENDCMIITGGKLHGGTVNSWNDHRIAMALGIAALGCDSPVKIINSECVSKSYPGFWKVLKKSIC
ncbi:MAG: aroA [Ignavibacteria bacterium]|nr:aroA [Ignavibacteria bacterium]